jgi:hypothetical protein
MRWMGFTVAVARKGVLVLLAAGMTAVALGQNNLVDVLKKKYVITQTTLNREQIANPGTVMDVQANGINAEPWDTIITFDNPVVDGSVQQRNKFLGLVKSKNMKILQPGDKVYITKIEGVANGKGDVLKFSILSCDPLDVDGGASQKRFSATVSFRLAKDGLSQTSPDDAERMVEAVMSPDAGGSGANDAAAEPAAAPQPAPAPRPVVRPAAQATPPPPAQTETIAMGQTIAQVVASMGQPLQIIDLGPKKTYKYKDLKVVFTNGKVSDVQ